MKTKLVFISGGGNYSPDAIKAELDKIRADLALSDDVVLFGIPAERDDGSATPSAAAEEQAKIIPFPIRKKPILNIIAKAEEAPAAPESEYARTGGAKFEKLRGYAQAEPGEKLVVNIDDDETESITELLSKLPPIKEDETPKDLSRSLADEFIDYLDKDEESAPKKKAAAAPFKRKKSIFQNPLGDLFNKIGEFAGGAANDDSRDYPIPDYIKRP